MAITCISIMLSVFVLNIHHMNDTISSPTRPESSFTMCLPAWCQYYKDTQAWLHFACASFFALVTNPTMYRIQITKYYKIIQGRAPTYLRQCIRHLSGPRQTRSTSSKKMHVNRTRSTYGDRSFSVGRAARLWNGLPQHFMPLEDKESFKRSWKLF
jgi:hypothetical protein